MKKELKKPKKEIVMIDVELYFGETANYKCK